MLSDPGGYAVLDLLHCCRWARYAHRLFMIPANVAPAERPTADRAEITRRPSRSVLDHRRGSLVQRHDPGTHLANGGLVSLGQAARAPALGLGSGPPGRIRRHRLCCALKPAQILEWFVLRWQLEVTFQEVRAHSSPVVGSRHRPHHANPDGPILLDHPGGSLDAGTTAHEPSHRGLVRQAVSNFRTIALVRRHLWLASEGFSLSDAEPDIWKVPAALYYRLVVRGLKCAKPRSGVVFSRLSIAPRPQFLLQSLLQTFSTNPSRRP